MINNGKKLHYSMLLTPEIGVLIPILVIGILTSIINPIFLTRRYIASILTGCVAIGAATLGEALVIMSGEIDLSLGYVGGLAGVLCGRAAMLWGWGTVPCILFGLLVGMTVGAITGFLVTKVGITSWITTMAAQFVCQGISLTITQGYPQSIESLSLLSFSVARPLGLSWLFFIFIFLIIVMDLVIRKTGFGYKLRAVGCNLDAAEMAGIYVKKVKWFAFVLAGLFAAIGGLFDVIQNQAASPIFGDGREFRAITCCAIGGISMTGGAGSIHGVFLGVLLFHVLWYCLRLLAVNINLQLVLTGVILILAVMLDMQRKRMEDRKLV